MSIQKDFKLRLKKQHNRIHHKNFKFTLISNLINNFCRSLLPCFPEMMYNVPRLNSDLMTYCLSTNKLNHPYRFKVLYHLC